MKHKYADLQPIFIGGTGRSGTTILSKFIGSHDKVVKIPMESRFIIDKGGLIDLFTSLTTNYSFDQGRIALRDFNVKMTRDMYNPYRAPYLGWNRGQQLSKYILKKSTEELLAELSLGSFEGFDYQTSDKIEYFHYLRRLLVLANRVIRRMTTNKTQPLFETSIGGLRPKENIYIPRYFTRNDEKEILDHLRNFVLNVLSEILSDKESVLAWCEDTPANILNIQFLQQLFPTAKYIHVMRNPIGVAYSMQRKIWAPSSLNQCCDVLEQLYMRLIDVQRKHINNKNYLFIRLEDLKFENEKVKLSNFLGLDSSGYSGKINIDPMKMNYFYEKMPESDMAYVSERLKQAIDFFGY